MLIRKVPYLCIFPVVQTVVGLSLAAACALNILSEHACALSRRIHVFVLEHRLTKLEENSNEREELTGRIRDINSISILEHENYNKVALACGLLFAVPVFGTVFATWIVISSRKESRLVS